jgi:hypothetical protein
MLRLFKCLLDSAFTALPSNQPLPHNNPPPPPSSQPTPASPPPRRHPAGIRRRRRHRQEPEAHSRSQSVGLHPYRGKRYAARQALREHTALTPPTPQSSPRCPSFPRAPLPTHPRARQWSRQPLTPRRSEYPLEGSVLRSSAASRLSQRHPARNEDCHLRPYHQLTTSLRKT